MSLVFATTFFFFFFFVFFFNTGGGGGGGGGYVVTRLTDFEFEISGPLLNTLLWSSICGSGSSLTSRVPVVWVLFKVLEPLAITVHPVHASVVHNTVAAYTSAADCTWELV